jgi:hypothetical protein
MRAALATLAATLGIVACGGNAGPGDFADEAADFIEGQMSEDNPDLTGVPFTEAQCDEPASTDVGATFTCVAVGSDGQTYSFSVSIDGERSLRVDSYAPVAAGATTTTTTVAGATTTTSTTSTSTTVPG